MKIYYFFALSMALVLMVPNDARPTPDKAPAQLALLKINQKYESRTTVKKSMIPGAGNGLFATLRIKKGEVIGELGGRLVSADDYPKGNHYVATLPECARDKIRPYKYIDSKDYGAKRKPHQFRAERNKRQGNQFPERGDQAALPASLFYFRRIEGYRAWRGDLVELRAQL